MNTIIVDYAEVEKSHKHTDFPFMHHFLFDKFKLIIKNSSWFGYTVKTIVEICGNGKILLHKYSINGELDRDTTPGYAPGEFEGWFECGLQYAYDYDIAVKSYDEYLALDWESGKDGYFDGWQAGCDGGNGNRMEEIAESMEYIVASLEERETNTVIKNSPERAIARTQLGDNKPQKVYLMDDIKKYFYINGAKSGGTANHIQCPCWSVRGHYRHYKSGKTIFVKSFLKGKERENAKPKDKTYYT